jgi:hypothetical protein
MSSVLIPKKTEQGWISKMPPEMALAVGVAEGSFVVMYVRGGEIETEILPPLTPEMKDIAQYVIEKNKELFEELKRPGD